MGGSAEKGGRGSCHRRPLPATHGQDLGLRDSVQIRMDMETPAKKVDAARALCPALMPNQAEAVQQIKITTMHVFSAMRRVDGDMGR